MTAVIKIEIDDMLYEKFLSHVAKSDFSESEYATLLFEKGWSVTPHEDEMSTGFSHTIVGNSTGWKLT